MTSDLVLNYGRSASDPPSTTGIWRGEVTSIDGDDYEFVIPRLTGVNASYKATTSVPVANDLDVGDNILLSFSEGRNDEIAVLGKINMELGSVEGYITGVTAGTNLNGGGTTGDITLNLDADITLDSVTATDVSANIFGPIHIQVKNTSGTTLAKGSAVYATGSVGASGAVEVQASDNTNTATMPALGLLDSQLAANAEGSVTILGVIKNIDTSSWSINDELWVNGSGQLQNSRPTSGLIQKIGRVVRVHASTGEILVLGAGRTNDVPFPLFVDHANQRVGIGTTTPSDTLDVAGNTISTGHFTAQSGGADGGIVLGQAFSSSYVGVRTAGMAETSTEYNLLTNGTHTFISAGTSGDVYIRGGGNSTAVQMFMDTSATTTYFTGGVNLSGRLTAGGGIDGLTLANGGISGSNYNITGVNQLEINDPGEGIVFKGGASGDYSMYLIDDSSDKILHVGGVTNSRLRVNAPSGNAELELSTSGVRWALFANSSDNSFNLYNTIGSTDFTFTTTGRLGINNNSPSYALDVGGHARLTGRILVGNSSAGAPGLSFSGDSNTGFYTTGNGGVVYWSGNNNTGGYLFNNGVRVDNGSASTPSYSFSTSDSTDMGMYRYGADRIGWSVGGDVTMLLQNSSTGLTGDGSRSLSVRSAGAPEFYRETSSTSAGVFVLHSNYGGTADLKWLVYADGDTASDTGSYGQLSDGRLKDNITDYKDPTDDLMAINVIKYDLTKRSIGVDENGDPILEDRDIVATMTGWEAQQVQSVKPGFVKQDDERGTLSVKSSVFVPLLHRGFQVHEDKIAALEARIAALET